MQRYVRTLETELLWVKPGSQLTQFYCGGGTPTALPAELLDRVLTSVFGRFFRRPAKRPHRGMLARVVDEGECRCFTKALH